jgi:hypothetical protein
LTIDACPIFGQPTAAVETDNQIFRLPNGSKHLLDSRTSSHKPGVSLLADLKMFDDPVGTGTFVEFHHLGIVIDPLTEKAESFGHFFA